MHCICLIVLWSNIDVVLPETSSDSLSRQMMTSHLPAFPACPPYPQSVQAYYCNTWAFCTPLARCEANGPVPSEKRALRVEFGSQKLGAWGQPTAYAQWMTMTRCANVSIGLQRKGRRETFAIRVALVHTGHSQGRPFAICRWQATCMGHLLWLKLLPHQNCGHIFRPNLRYPAKVWSNQCFFVLFVGCLWAVGISYIILYLPNR